MNEKKVIAVIFVQNINANFQKEKYKALPQHDAPLLCPLNYLLQKLLLHSKFEFFSPAKLYQKRFFFHLFLF